MNSMQERRQGGSVKRRWMRGMSVAAAVVVGLMGAARAAHAQSTTPIINPTGLAAPARVAGSIATMGERDAWLFYAPSSGRALLAAAGANAANLDLRFTIYELTTNRVIVGPVDYWRARMVEQETFQVVGGRWYGVIVDAGGARTAMEATGRYEILLSTPGRATRMPVAPRWPITQGGGSGSGSGGSGSVPRGYQPTTVTRTIASWSVRLMAGQSSRVSDNQFISLRPGETAKVVVTGLPAAVRDRVQFTLMHDKRNASDQPRRGPIGHGSTVFGSQHNWPDFGTRIYIGRISSPWTREALFRAYPNFRVELQVTSTR